MGSSASIPADKKVVIVGAGYGGVTLAMELMKRKSSFLLIDRGDAMHLNVASVRAIVQPGFAKRTLIPLAPTFGDLFRQGSVQSIDVNVKKVTLEDGSSIPYDILVIATGTGGPFPFKVDGDNHQAIIQQHASLLEEVERSSKILIVGGGSTGMELTGEIVTSHADKEVTIVTGGDVLIQPGLTDNFHKKLKNITDQYQIKVITSDRVETEGLTVRQHGEFSVTTRQGVTIDTNLIIPCTGVQVNSQAYASAFSGDKMESNGALKVDEFLRVEGYEDVYSIGDCSNTNEPKHAASAMNQALYLADRLCKTLANQTTKPYRANSQPHKIAVTFGSRHGVGELKNDWGIPAFVVKGVKGKDFMTGKSWKDMKQTVPQ